MAQKTPEPKRRPTDERPVEGPKGPRTPYPVDDPAVSDPRGPGSEPDVVPGPPTPPTRI